jgi:hypothetical protein
VVDVDGGAADDLPGAGPLEVGEAQPDQPRIHIVPQVACHPPLQNGNAELLHVEGDVLHEVHTEQQEDDVPQRLHGRLPLDEAPHRAVQHPIDRSDLLGNVGRDSLKDVEEGLEQREAERIQPRVDDHGRQRQREHPGIGAEVLQYPAVPSHRGVNSATGRIISSGLTPPCRKLPRYLA